MLGGAASAFASNEAEKWDVVNPMSVAFIPTLGKRVMIHGGDLNHAILPFVSPGAVPDPDRERRHPRPCFGTSRPSIRTRLC